MRHGTTSRPTKSATNLALSWKVSNFWIQVAPILERPPRPRARGRPPFLLLPLQRPRLLSNQRRCRMKKTTSPFDSQRITFHVSYTFPMAKTEVILTHNIVGLGGESDHVKVAAGYARNYLYPQGLAIPVTAANKRRLEVLKQRRGERESHDLNTMTELSKSLSKLTCVITVKTGDDGKMFGSVTTGMIADQLKTQFDVTLDKRKIHLA